MDGAEERSMYCVYCHTNKINGKKYVGITSLDPKVRWQNGHGYRTQPFGRAIKKYGWDAFEHEILASGLSEEEAKSLEIKLICEFKTRDREYGYNICEGGDTGTTGVKYGEDVRKNMSAATISTYKRDPSIKKRISESVKKLYEDPEYAEHMRQIRKELWNRPGYREHQVEVRLGRFYRKEVTQETRRKISDKKRGKKRPEDFKQKMKEISKKTPVIQMDKSGKVLAVFESMKEAEKATGIRNGCISLCCSGKRGTAGGYMWKPAKEATSDAVG